MKHSTLVDPAAPAMAGCGLPLVPVQLSSPAVGTPARRLWWLVLIPLLAAEAPAQDSEADSDDIPIARAVPVDQPDDAEAAAADEAMEDEAAATAPQGLPVAQRPGPQPEPVRGTEFAPRSRGETVRVNAEGSGFFDADENKATFTDNVRVVHPSFNLTADQLEVFLEDNRPAETDDPAATNLDSAVAGGSSPQADGEGGGIRLAIARGRRVVIHRLSDEGELMVAICRHATFDGRTREMTLRDWPQVQRGVNLIRATEQSAVIVLTEDGRLRTQGGTRTELVRGADEDAGRVILPPPGPED